MIGFGKLVILVGIMDLISKRVLYRGYEHLIIWFWVKENKNIYKYWSKEWQITMAVLK